MQVCAGEQNTLKTGICMNECVHGVILAMDISHEECFVLAILDFSFSIFMQFMSHAIIYGVIFWNLDLLKHKIWKIHLRLAGHIGA